MKVCVLVFLAALVACAYSAATECADGCASQSGGGHDYCTAQCTSCTGHVNCNHHLDKCECHTNDHTHKPH